MSRDPWEIFSEGIDALSAEGLVLPKKKYPCPLLHHGHFFTGQIKQRSDANLIIRSYFRRSHGFEPGRCKNDSLTGPPRSTITLSVLVDGWVISASAKNGITLLSASGSNA